jgi:hypothetical protein
MTEWQAFLGLVFLISAFLSIVVAYGKFIDWWELRKRPHVPARSHAASPPPRVTAQPPTTTPPIQKPAPPMAPLTCRLF